MLAQKGFNAGVVLLLAVLCGYGKSLPTANSTDEAVVHAGRGVVH